MLQAIDISLRRGEQVLFSNLSCTIHPRQKVGIVGRNGVGKSSFFQLLLGRLQPETGEVRRPPGWRVSHMAQQVAVTERPALDYVIDGHRALRQVEHDIQRAEQRDDALRLANLHASFADLGGYEAQARAAEILHGLGFTSADFARPFAAFSGGWRIRLNLAQALMAPADLLLLDEPTNHLDLDTTLWLEGWLKRFDGTLLIIAHDRAFLDGVTDHILHLHGGAGDSGVTADTYRGNYSSFERQRAEALVHQQAAAARQQAEVRHMQSFIERFKAKASKAKQAQSRVKALERMQLVAPVHADSPYHLAFTNPDKMSSPLLSLLDVSLGYGAEPVLRDISQTILPGARIGVLGANGAGKSTLLKCLVGSLEPMAGTLTRGANSAVGYFAQHQLETLNAEASPLEQLAARLPDAREQYCRDYLGTWGFPGEMATRAIGTLSGGEKARLALALIAQSKPALLVLDEPTNHLDLDMREALAMALQDYAGALLLVSHDRSLHQRSVDEFWLVADGTVSPYDGDLDSYTAGRGEAARLAPAERPSNRKSERQAAAAQREREKPLRDQVKRQEREMERVGAELGTLEARLAEPGLYQELPAAELDALLARAGELRRRLEAAEECWLEASEALEVLNAQSAAAGRS